MKLLIDIPVRMVGGNKIKALKPYKYRALRQIIRKLLTDWLFQGYPGAFPRFDRALLVCTYVATTNRDADADNLAFSFKPWLDELQVLGILGKDSMKKIGVPEYRREVGVEYRCRIELRSPEE